MFLQNDTISCNTERLADYINNPSYAYNNELLAPEPDIYSYISRWLNEFLRGIFGSRFAEVYTEPILIGIFIAVIVLVIWFIYKKRPELFMRTVKKKLSYEVHEDTIYGIDFEGRIKDALAKKNYKEASRLLYLQTLKDLTDEEFIDWQLYKTPTEYIYEVKPENVREPFRELTNSFLRVRYGNFEATDITFQEMKVSREKLRKEMKNER